MGRVDLHEKRQLDLAEHVAKVNEQVAKAKAHARPWRAIIATVLAVIAGVVASQAGQNFKDWTGHGHYVYKIVAAACIAAFFIFGAIAVLGLAGKTREVLTPAVGSSHAAVVRYAILLIGGVTVLCLGVSLMKVPIGQLLVGGAVTTILLGIAGQQSLANIFAGLVLLLSRPFMVGDYIRLKSGALGGITDGLVAEIGITYLRLDTEDGTLHLPNSQVLAAAVGPIAPPRPRESGPVESGPVPETPVPALEPAKPDALEPAKPDHDDPPYGGPPYGSP
jgi:small-conductance mechanosensitive channel